MSITFETSVTIKSDSGAILIPDIECRVTCEKEWFLKGEWIVTAIELQDWDKTGKHYRPLDTSDGHIFERQLYGEIANIIEADQDVIAQHDDGERYDPGLAVYADVRGAKV